MRKKAAAIKYLKENLEVPVITALGYDKFADEIIKEAEKNGIEVVANKDFFVYENLFKAGGEIPPDVYKIVVDILVFVMKTNEKREK
jgi:flagellar biosynthesis protein